MSARSEVQMSGLDIAAIMAIVVIKLAEMVLGCTSPDGKTVVPPWHERADRIVPHWHKRPEE